MQSHCLGIVMSNSDPRSQAGHLVTEEWVKEQPNEGTWRDSDFLGIPLTLEYQEAAGRLARVRMRGCPQDNQHLSWPGRCSPALCSLGKKLESFRATFLGPGKTSHKSLGLEKRPRCLPGCGLHVGRGEGGGSTSQGEVTPPADSRD